MKEMLHVENCLADPQKGQLFGDADWFCCICLHSCSMLCPPRLFKYSPCERVVSLLQCIPWPWSWSSCGFMKYHIPASFLLFHLLEDLGKPRQNGRGNSVKCFVITKQIIWVSHCFFKYSYFPLGLYAPFISNSWIFFLIKQWKTKLKLSLEEQITGSSNK